MRDGEAGGQRGAGPEHEARPVPGAKSVARSARSSRRRWRTQRGGEAMPPRRSRQRGSAVREAAR